MGNPSEPSAPTGSPAVPRGRPWWRLKLVTRGALARLAVLLGILAVPLAWAGCTMLYMPGSSYRGPLPAMTEHETALAVQLRRDVETLAQTIGPRHLRQNPARLEQAARFIEDEFQKAGYQVQPQEFTAGTLTTRNLEVEIRGGQRPSEILVIGAHYDSADNTPAANDNGSGVAALLALARALAQDQPARTVRFVAFTAEEPPYFQTDLMGSRVYARRCKERGENIVGMLSLETMGCFSDAPSSQQYPFPFNLFFPSTGNFIAFAGNVRSRALVRQTVGAFRRHVKFPSEGAALPEAIPESGFSDQWSFWQEGYPALMVTDTAFFRYPHYHLMTDTPDRLDYDRLARVVAGLEAVVRELANAAD